MPSVFRHLVAAYMKILIRKKLTKFIHYILDKFICAFFSCTQNIMLYSPMVCDRQISFKTAEVIITSQSTSAVSRNIKFRHNRNTEIMCIFDYTFNLSFCVIALMLPMIKIRLFPYRPDLRQQRIFVNLNSPSLVLRQMQMQKIKLVQRHFSNKQLDLVYGIEISPDIKHKASDFILRLILYRNKRNRSAVFKQ